MELASGFEAGERSPSRALLDLSSVWWIRDTIAVSILSLSTWLMEESMGILEDILIGIRFFYFMVTLTIVDRRVFFIMVEREVAVEKVVER